MVKVKSRKGVEVDLNNYHKLHFDDGKESFLDVTNQNILRSAGFKLAAFLPHAVETNGGSSVLFELPLGRRERASTSKSRSKTARDIPKRQIDEFEAGINDFLASKSDPKTSPRGRKIIENLLLPDPDLDPELYRSYGPPWDRRLLVIWGLEKRRSSSLKPSVAIAKLRRGRTGGVLPLAACAALLGLLLVLGLLAWTQWPSAKLQLTPRDTATIGQWVHAEFDGSRGDTFVLNWDEGEQPIAMPEGSKFDSRKFMTPGEKTVALRASASVFGLLPVSSMATAHLKVANRTPIIPSPPPVDSPLVGQYLRVTLVPEGRTVPSVVRVFVALPKDKEIGGIVTLAEYEYGIAPGETLTFPETERAGNYRVEWQPAPNNFGIHGEFVRFALYDPNRDSGNPVANLIIPEIIHAGETFVPDVSTSLPPKGGEIETIEISDPLTKQYRDNSKELYPITIDEPGDYEISLRVTDDKGNRDTCSRRVKVVPLGSSSPPPVEVPLTQQQVDPLRNIGIDKDKRDDGKRGDGTGQPKDPPTPNNRSDKISPSSTTLAGPTPKPTDVPNNRPPDKPWPGPDPVPDDPISDPPRRPSSDRLMMEKFVNTEAKDRKQDFILRAKWVDSPTLPVAVRQWKLDGTPKTPVASGDLQLTLPEGEYLVEVVADLNGRSVRMVNKLVVKIEQEVKQRSSVELQPYDEK